MVTVAGENVRSDRVQRAALDNWSGRPVRGGRTSVTIQSSCNKTNTQTIRCSGGQREAGWSVGVTVEGLQRVLTLELVDWLTTPGCWCSRLVSLHVRSIAGVSVQRMEKRDGGDALSGPGKLC